MPDLTGGQFPSLDGHPDAEIDQRTPGDNSQGMFRKVFTLHSKSHTPGLPPEHESHWHNAVAVLQDAIQRGLHPKGVPHLVSEEPHPSAPNNTNLTYEVPVVPAVADTEPHTTVTPSDLASHERYVQSLDHPDENPDEDEVHEQVQHLGAGVDAPPPAPQPEAAPEQTAPAAPES